MWPCSQRGMKYLYGLKSSRWTDVFWRPLCHPGQSSSCMLNPFYLGIALHPFDWEPSVMDSSNLKIFSYIVIDSLFVVNFFSLYKYLKMRKMKYTLAMKIILSSCFLACLKTDLHSSILILSEKLRCFLFFFPSIL